MGPILGGSIDGTPALIERSQRSSPSPTGSHIPGDGDSTVGPYVAAYGFNLEGRITH